MIKMAKNIGHRKTALAVIVDKNDKILICLSDRDNMHWKFPQGGIENYESPKQALIREIKEELNIDIDENEILNESEIESYFFDNGFEIKLHPFLIRHNIRNNIQISPDEFCDFQWIKPEEVETLKLGVRKDAYLNILKNMKLI